MAAVDNSMGALCTAWHNSWYASLVPAALDVWIFFWKFGIRRHVTFLERYPSFASRDAGNFPRGGNDLDIQKLADTAPQGKAGCELVGGIRVDRPQRLARPAGRAMQQTQLGCPEVWDSAAPLQLGFVGRCHLSQLGNAS